MHDRDIRDAVHVMLSKQHADDVGTRVVDEMGIWSGTVRIDIAVINGSLTGFELKSDRDTLERLPSQAELYSRIFDQMYLVVGSRHYAKARKLVPAWWGITVAKQGTTGVELVERRSARINPKPDPVLLAKLLWRQEALDVLEAFGLARGWRSKTTDMIHNRLATELPLDQVSNSVREALKKRSGWLGQFISN